jgi:hypothetical protein
MFMGTDRDALCLCCHYMGDNVGSGRQRFDTVQEKVMGFRKEEIL